jgi:hypothetical protein
MDRQDSEQQQQQPNLFDLQSLPTWLQQLVQMATTTSSNTPSNNSTQALQPNPQFPAFPSVVPTYPSAVLPTAPVWQLPRQPPTPHRPANLPQDLTVQGGTSSSAYLNAAWQSGMVMPTLHARVIDISEPRSVNIHRAGMPTTNLVSSLLVSNDSGDIVQVSAWGPSQASKLYQGAREGQVP